MSAKSSGSGRRTLYLVFGILLVLAGLLFVLMTIVSFSMPPSVAPWAATMFGVCTATFLVPGVLLLYLFWRANAQDKLYQAVGAILRSVKEVTVDDVAKRLGKTPAETEVLISETVAAGHAQGFVDPRERKFVATAWGGYGPGQTPQIIVQAPQQPVYIPQPVYAPPPPLQVQVIREIVKVPCRYCGALVESTATQCPRCTAPLR